MRLGGSRSREIPPCSGRRNLFRAKTQEVGHQLASAVVAELDRAEIAMTQVLLAAGRRGSCQRDFGGWISSSGRFAVSVVRGRSTCRTIRREERARVSCRTIDRSAARLSALVERTYEGSLDCAALNGARHMDDVIDGLSRDGHVSRRELADRAARRPRMSAC